MPQKLRKDHACTSSPFTLLTQSTVHLPEMGILYIKYPVIQNATHIARMGLKNGNPLLIVATRLMMLDGATLQMHLAL